MYPRTRLLMAQISIYGHVTADKTRTGRVSSYPLRHEHSQCPLRPRFNQRNHERVAAITSWAMTSYGFLIISLLLT
jgi:hypothetical protein